ncbi:flavin monoamine oxidase family protein [Sphingomonas sp.]|uniref:flavin monoamine oxidase family protein n=1 Tax=Sphingomonas sp. TaxID=28214 RepID=UPI003B00AF77
MIDIAIVGAGAAGVAAARSLARDGRRVALLEASQRIGGRARTEAVAGMALDLGCGWLHSAERNAWTRIAEEAGYTVDRTAAAWGRQWRDLGFSAADRAEAERAREEFAERVAGLTRSDRAADALEPGGRWNPWLQAISGYVNGAALEHVSAADYLAYDRAASDCNWRVREGYGALVAASLPATTETHLATPVTSLALTRVGVALATPRGTVEARTAIVTVSSTVLADERLRLPPQAADHVEAAARLPLGVADKLFLAIDDPAMFERETHLLGDPHDANTGSYTIMPMGRPVIETFFGGPGAEALEREGAAAAQAFALDELAALLGSGVRRVLRPIAASAWRRADHVGGSYSHALPGHAAARAVLAAPAEDRLFFAGEATHPTDYSTAHGAHDSGVRAAAEAQAALGGDRRHRQQSAS